MPQGKFIKRLEEISAGASPSIGFKASQVAMPPALLLTVVLPAIDAEHAAAAIEGGAEALIVRVSLQEAAKEEASLKEVLAAAGGKPCGFVPVGPWVHGTERLQRLQSLGFDFVVISAHDTPDVMCLENVGKVMLVDHTFDNDLIRTINDLSVDAVEVFLGRPEDFGKHFSIRDLMQYKLYRMLLRKPIIVRGERSIKPEDVAGLCDVGVEGLVIDATVTGSDPQTIKEGIASYTEAIHKLGPAARKKRDKVAPIIPSVKPSIGGHSGEPEEPEEPDEI